MKLSTATMYAALDRVTAPLRICTLCGLAKPFGQFTSTWNRKRTAAWCKLCAARREKERRASRSETQRGKDLARTSAYWRDHRQHLLECVRNWKTENPERLSFQRRRRNCLLFFGGPEIKKLIPESLPALVEARLSYLDLVHEVKQVSRRA